MYYPAENYPARGLKLKLLLVLKLKKMRVSRLLAMKTADGA